MAELSRTVFVGADGSPPSDRAVRWAAADAGRRRLPLCIVHVLEDWIFDIPVRPERQIRKALEESGRRILDEARALALSLHPELDIDTRLVHKHTVPGGLRERSVGGFELVVGHRGRGGFTELLLGSTGQRLTRHQPGPVIVVRGESTADEVVVGLDLRNAPEAALEHAFSTAAAWGAALRAVHAWWPAPLAVAAGLDVGAAEETLRERLAATMAPWSAQHPDVEVIGHIIRDHPVNALVDLSARAGLTVVGVRAHTGPHLGSVSHGAVHHAHCPVAIVRARA